VISDRAFPRILLGIGACAVLAVFAWAALRNTPKAAEIVVQPEYVTKATISELTKAYAANAVTAQDTYKGKLIEVSGKIDSISNVSGGSGATVLLTDGEGFAGFYFTKSQRGLLGNVKVGSPVTCTGRLDEFRQGSPTFVAESLSDQPAAPSVGNGPLR
jgi:DNA/RNA endonuclease YhcR with UshA esterase domain